MIHDNIYKDYGSTRCNLNEIMKEEHLTKTMIVKKTGLHHRVVAKYMNNEIIRYDKDVLARFCYVLNCDISDLISYVVPKEKDL